MLRHYLAVTLPWFTVVLSLLQLLKDDIQKELAPVYGWQGLPPSHTNPLKFFKLSNFHKISRLSNSGLKIGNLTNFIIKVFFISGNNFVLPPIFMIYMVRFGHVTLSCKEPIYSEI